MNDNNISLAVSQLERVTAVEYDSDGTGAVFFGRDAAGAVFSGKLDFHPFVILTADGMPEEFPGREDVEITPLAGEGFWRTMISFPDRDSWQDFTGFAAKNRIPVWQWRDLRTQILTLCGVRSFKGMSFEELKRVTVAVKCTEKGGIDSIVCRGSDGSRRTFSGNEHDLLKEFAAWFRETDCDVLEGFEICREILPLLTKRAKAVKVELALGRDGSVPVSRPSRFALPDLQINYPRWEIYGRQVVDLWMLCCFYDSVKRVLEDNTLEAAAAHFNIAAEDDCAAAAVLSTILLPSYFYQSVFLPMPLQEVIARGNGSTVDALLVSEYIIARHALPLPEDVVRYPGALVGMETAGVIKNVWHCDVRSLYPSILAAGGMAPERDQLKVFPQLISELRAMRLKLKDGARSAGSVEEQRKLDVMQKVLKIMINSFYGYLGFAQGAFNDFALAAEVTARGREILNNICAFLQEKGAGIIEKDTDGVYFSPPADCTAVNTFQAEIQAILPEGIDIEIDAVYQAMFSYKSKNYALLCQDGTVEIAGAALKSRGMEPFLREFIYAMIKALLDGNGSALPRLRDEWEEKVRTRAFPLAMMAKSEKLSDSPANYKRKMEAGTGRRSAAYEVALASGRQYRAGDTVAFYLTGTKPKPSVADAAREVPETEPEAEARDENIPAYLRKIADVYENFREFAS